MGAFFTNIQIYIDEKYSIQNREQIITLLKNELIKQGYKETDIQTENTRTLAISNINNNWISLYDEYIEENHYGESIFLSKSITNPLVLISVFDSDIIDLKLLRNGKILDNFNNQSQIVNKNIFAKARKTLGIKLNPWNILNLDKLALQRLNKAWNNNYVFAEELLEKTAEIMNWNKDYCSVGYKYLGDSKLDDLLFIRFKKDECEKISEHSLGLPAFEFLAYDSSIQGSINEVKEFPTILFNAGMESKGLSVGIYGEAIENKYVEVDKILVFNSLKTMEKGEIIKTCTTENNDLILGKLDTVEIQKNFNSHSMEWSKMIEKRYASSIQVKIYLKLLKECNSTINFAFIPNSNQKNGQVSLKTPIKISN